jgi:hypothetical protein
MSGRFKKATAERFRGVKRIRPVDHHSDLPPGTAQPRRYGQKLNFVVVSRLAMAGTWKSTHRANRALGFGAVPTSDLGRIGLNVMLAFSAPNASALPQ